MSTDLKKDFYRQTIRFMVVPEYGGKPEQETYFYDQITSYADYTAPRAPNKGDTGARAYILLKHKATTNNALFPTKKRFVTHSQTELEDMFSEAEYKIERSKHQISALIFCVLHFSSPLLRTPAMIARP